MLTVMLVELYGGFLEERYEEYGKNAKFPIKYQVYSPPLIETTCPVI